MTEYQKKFIIKCLDKISTILSNEQAIVLAVKAFTGNDPTNKRYKSSQITNIQSWSDIEQTRITSVISEATYQVTSEMCNEAIMTELSTANRVFLETIVPKITAHCTSENKLNSVKENCAKMSAEMRRATTQASSYSFFQFAVGAAVVATVAAFALK